MALIVQHPNGVCGVSSFTFLFLSLSVFDLWLHICVPLCRAEKTEVLSDDLLQVNITLSFNVVHARQSSILILFYESAPKPK